MKFVSDRVAYSWWKTWSTALLWICLPNFRVHEKKLPLLVLKPEYSGQTWPVSSLLMHWLLGWTKLLQPWYWLCIINLRVLSSTTISTIVFYLSVWNKADLRDLMAATGLVILNRIQIVDFSVHVTLKSDGWPQKTIGHFFHTKSSCMRHFKSISEFKLELQSGNAQLASKLMIFCPVWPWYLIDDLGKQYFLENKTSWKTILLYHIKLCVLLQIHRWSQTWVTVRKRSIRVKIGDFFCSMWPWNVTNDLEK